jgi:hypothetical protein
MRGALIVLIVLVLVAFTAVKIGGMVAARSNFSDRVAYRLDFVDKPDDPAVKQDLIADAAKVGIELKPENIVVIYEDSEQRTVPQQFLGKIAEFTNKRVAINAHYVVRILGVPFEQDITQSKIKIVQTRPKRDTGTIATPQSLDVAE